jgi:hypothetical protein
MVHHGHARLVHLSRKQFSIDFYLCSQMEIKGIFVQVVQSLCLDMAIFEKWEWLFMAVFFDDPSDTNCSEHHYLKNESKNLGTIMCYKKALLTEEEV